MTNDDFDEPQEPINGRRSDVINVGNPMHLKKRTNSSGNRQPRVDEEAYRLLRKAAETYADRRRPTKRSVHLHMQFQFMEINAARTAAGQSALPVPSIGTLSREIQKLDSMWVCAVRGGVEKAKKQIGNSTFKERDLK